MFLSESAPTRTPVGPLASCLRGCGGGTGPLDRACTLCPLVPRTARDRPAGIPPGARTARKSGASVWGGDARISDALLSELRRLSSVGVINTVILGIACVPSEAGWSAGTA